MARLLVAGGGPILLLLTASSGSTAAPWPPALQSDHPDLSRDDARAMTRAALADALLAPGYPAFVEATLLPGVAMPPLPPNSPVRLQVRLVGPAALDRRSGFCVKRSVEVTTTRPGSGRAETVAPSTAYRLPDSTADPCAGSLFSFFTPLPAERVRAAAVVRIVAAAVRQAKRAPLPFPLSVDDEADRQMADWLAKHPDQRRPGDPDYREITDARAAFAALPVTAIGFVGHNLYGGELLPPALGVGADGRPRERWSLLVGAWTADVALDGDRIAAVALRQAISPPS